MKVQIHWNYDQAMKAILTYPSKRLRASTQSESSWGIPSLRPGLVMKFRHSWFAALEPSLSCVQPPWKPGLPPTAAESQYLKRTKLMTNISLQGLQDPRKYSHISSQTSDNFVTCWAHCHFTHSKFTVAIITSTLTMSSAKDLPVLVIGAGK